MPFLGVGVVTELATVTGEDLGSKSSTHLVLLDIERISTIELSTQSYCGPGNWYNSRSQ